MDPTSLVSSLEWDLRIYQMAIYLQLGGLAYSQVVMLRERTSENSVNAKFAEHLFHALG